MKAKMITRGDVRRARRHINRCRTGSAKRVARRNARRTDRAAILTGDTDRITYGLTGYDVS